MGRLRIEVAECNYKEVDSEFKEQFINSLNDNDMLVEIICELTDMTDMCKVTNE